MADEEKNKESEGRSEDMGKQGVSRSASGHGDKVLSAEQRKQMQHMHHKQTLWIYWTLIMLGIWMVLSPLTFSYSIGAVEPSGGRKVWLSLEGRIAAMKWSDIISGILLIIFGWRSLRPNRPVSLWICCFVGIWISMAPLLFWAPTAVAYLNGTLVGVWVITLTILVPGLPNIIRFIKKGSQFPDGWSYNPSSWPQRWILLVMGFLGWMVSRYLGAYQLGYIDYAWDPFFGGGTVQVLDSELSHSFPISDAALGSLAYTIEFLLGFMGGTSRFRTMPWMVVMFGILVIPLGLVSIFLVIAQSVIVGVWCTICLLTAILMLPVIPLEIDEVVATVHDLVRKKLSGDWEMWEVFWKGSSTEDKTVDERTPELIELPHNFKQIFYASIWGISFPWTLVVSTVLGMGVMSAPAVIGVSIETRAADISHLFGAIIIVVAVISMAEVVRIFRYVNIVMGLILAVSIWFAADSVLALNLSAAIVGILVALLSNPRGKILEEYGEWEKYMR